MELLKVVSLSKQVGAISVLKDCSFTQERNSKLAIAGETGSGKSTLLKIIAGLVQPDSGDVLFENVRVKGPLEKLIAGHPSIAYLSQQFELLNNYRVEELLEYANKLSDQEADQVFRLCRIDHLLKRRTDQVSGGEKQRIAIARLLISSPELLLLDEPYSNLDLIHRNILRSVIEDIGAKLNISCLLVSHEPADTLSWAEEIIVLRQGEIVQKGNPMQIYRSPINEYVAGLFGKYNLVKPGELFNLPELAGNGTRIFLRPEDFRITKSRDGTASGSILSVSFLGSSYELEIGLPFGVVTVRTASDSYVKGEIVFVSVHTKNLWYI